MNNSLRTLTINLFIIIFNLFLIIGGIYGYVKISQNTWKIEDKKTFTYDLFIPDDYLIVSNMPSYIKDLNSKETIEKENITIEEYKKIAKEKKHLIEIYFRASHINLRIQTTLPDNNFPGKIRSVYVEQKIFSPILSWTVDYSINKYKIDEKEQTITIYTKHDYNDLLNIIYFLSVLAITIGGILIVLYIGSSIKYYYRKTN